MKPTRPRKKPGPPPSEEPIKQPITVHVRPASLEWMDKNLARGTSRSAFVDDAIAEAIERRKKRASM